MAPLPSLPHPAPALAFTSHDAADLPAGNDCQYVAP